MLKQYGYGCQVVNVTTEDGYINTLHRILPRSNLSHHKRIENELNTKVVFLQHGLLGTSADYVMGSPEKSLGEKDFFNFRSNTFMHFIMNVL